MVDEYEEEKELDFRVDKKDYYPQNPLFYLTLIETDKLYEDKLYKEKVIISGNIFNFLQPGEIYKFTITKGKTWNT